MSNTTPAALVDSYGRQVRDLRISITDRCNFRCRYCMPEEGMVWLDRTNILTFEEIERISKICVDHFDFNGIRLTGGEPTVRAQLPLLIQRLSKLRTPSNNEPIDLAMTTNGATLRLIAHEIKDAGLSRLNISLDSLSRKRFSELTRRDQLDKVLDGIDSALEVGFQNVKLNIVLIRSINDDELVEFAEFGRTHGVTPRFIEFMPLDASNEWSIEQVVPAQEIVQKISEVFPIEELRHTSEPATRYRYLDGKGEFGVIPSVTRPFCANCDRIRLTAEGKLRTCLFSVEEFDLKEPLRNGASDLAIAQEIARAVGLKWRGHKIGNVSFIKPKRTMSQIGG